MSQQPNINAMREMKLQARAKSKASTTAAPAPSKKPAPSVAPVLSSIPTSVPSTETLETARPFRRGASMGIDNPRVLSSRVSCELHQRLAAKLAELNAVAISRNEQKFSQRELIETAFDMMLRRPEQEWFR